MLVIYKPRKISYDEDWKEGFKAAGGLLHDWSQETRFHDDLTVLLHSITAQWGPIPDWIYREAQARKGKLVLFFVNEFKNLDEKRDLAKRLGVDLIASQLGKDDAERLYDSPVVETPHALNPDFFYSRKAPQKRPFDIGVRGHQYPASVGDDDRNRIHDPNLWNDLRHDCRPGTGHFVGRERWAMALSRWRTMPSCEGGMVRGKCMTPRHFDAIGSLTTLVMYPGRYNGILSENNYVRLEPDHSNLAEVKSRIRDKAHCEEIALRTREYINDCHTYRHRAEFVIKLASG
jgi:hypothetical protein